MKKSLKRIFCGVLSAAMLITLTGSLSAPALAEDTKFNQDFSEFTQDKTVPEKLEFGNIPPDGTGAQDLYGWTPVKGLWGKADSDTALHFVSKWDQGTLPSVPGSNLTISNPFVNFLLREKDIGTKTLHISFEIARDGGASNMYLQLRPLIGGATKRFDPEGVFYVDPSGATNTEVPLKMFGREIGHQLKYKRWSKVDFILYPQYETEHNGQQGTYTVLDCYVDGDQVQDKMVWDADNGQEGVQLMEGMDFLRIAMDPIAQNGVYPETNTYLDNFMYELTDAAPVITKITLSHDDPELNGYINNEERIIEGHGQTVEEMLSGLQASVDAAFTFCDKNGVTVTSGGLTGKYLRVTNTGDGTQAYYEVENLDGYIKNSDFIIDRTNNRVSGLYLYTPVSQVKEGLELYPDCSAKIMDNEGIEADDTADVKSGMKLVISKAGEPAVEEYTLDVYGKALDYHFNQWDKKLYYTEPPEVYDGVKFSGPKLADGIDPAAAAYVEPVKEAGRGKVLHSYVDSDYGTNFHHMNLLLDKQPTKEQIGNRFVMELSLKADENASLGSQAKFIKKSDGTENFLNPINFTNGNISVMNTIITTYQPNKWYDIKAYCDTTKASDNLVVYINNDKAFEGTSATVGDFKYFTDVRILQHFFKADVTQNAWLDDFQIYGVGGLTDSFLQTMETGLRSEQYMVDGTQINGYAGMTAKQLKEGAIVAQGAEVTVYEADGETLVAEEVLVQPGMILRVVTSNGSTFCNYVLHIADYQVGEIKYFVNGSATDHRFAPGTLKMEVSVECYLADPVPLMLVIAQYEDGKLTGVKMEAQSVQGTGGEVKTVSLSQDIVKAEGTTVKLMLWNSPDSVKPLQESVLLTPFSNEQIENVAYFYPGYTRKAVTFSYDDCVNQDQKLIDLFQQAGIRGTFNLQTNKFYNQSDAVRNEIKARYEGQEIATHTRTHPRMYLTQPETINGQLFQPLTLAECQADMQGGVEDIKELFGIDTQGMAWPYNRPSGRADFEEMLQFIAGQGIKYIRGVQESGGFELPSDWMDWRPTCHHDAAKNKWEQFKTLSDDGNLKVCYIWGHAYELDESYNPQEANKLRWAGMKEVIDEIGAAAGNQEIWVPTNLELHDYVEAVRALEIDYENNQVRNPSDVTVYVKINGQNVEIKPHGIGKL